MADGIYELGKAIGGLPNMYKQQREQGKAADLLFKSTPEFQEMVKISPEEWDTLGSRDKVRAMQRVSDVTAMQRVFADLGRMKLGNEGAQMEIDGAKEQKKARGNFFSELIGQSQPAPMQNPEAAFKSRQPDWSRVMGTMNRTGYQPTSLDMGLLDSVIGKPVDPLDVFKAETGRMGAETDRGRLDVDRSRLDLDKQKQAASAQGDWNLQVGQYVKGPDGRFGLASTPSSVQWFEQKTPEVEAKPVRHEGKVIGVMVGNDFKSLTELRNDMPQFAPATDTSGKPIDGLYVNTQTRQALKMTPDVLGQLMQGAVGGKGTSAEGAAKTKWRYEPGKGLRLNE